MDSAGRTRVKDVKNVMLDSMTTVLRSGMVFSLTLSMTRTLLLLVTPFHFPSDVTRDAVQLICAAI